MTTALAIYEARKVELSYLQSVGQVLADTHFFKDANTAEKAVATILAGQEFGLGPLEAMRSFHVIDGKVEMSADAQARLVKGSDRYDYRVRHLTDEVCSIEFYEDGETLGLSEFSIADAERAGLVKADGAWAKYPRNMCFARAMTNGIAWFCPDAIAGGRVYAPGEIGGQAWEQPLELEPVAANADQSHEHTVGGVGAERGSDEDGAAPAPAPSDPTSEEPGNRDETPAYGEGASGPSDPGSSLTPEAGGSDSAAAAAPEGEPERGGHYSAAPAPTPRPDSRDEAATAEFFHPGKKHIMQESATEPGVKFCRRGREDGKGGDPCEFILWPTRAGAA